LWHPRLAQVVTALGHGELLVVADPGLPAPASVEVIDLVFARGEPGLVPVLRTILGELVVEAAIIAEELADEKLLAAIDDLLDGTPCERVPHDAFKAIAGRAPVLVRTGEDTPYANIALRAGVPF
jgi:D-ribose pyranase